jgi:TRAP transporter TAXI family solute receptor
MLLRKLFGAMFGLAAIALLAGAAPSPSAPLGETLEVGRTGFDVKRPVFASACPQACPWGELGEFVQAAMKPAGYDVVLCRNCNRDKGAPIVSRRGIPPAIDAGDMRVGTTQRVNAPVDFGVTESLMLSMAYEGKGMYAGKGPLPNLRVIAKLEDPTYLMVAVRKDSGITDLAQIRDRKMPVRILADFQPSTTPVLDYYGLTREAVASWGGSFGNALEAAERPQGAASFDVIVSSLASPANNPESSFWTRLTQLYDLHFLDLPEPLLAKMAREVPMERAVAKWGLLRGVDRSIPTVARSGETIFARADLSDADAYAIAKAIDRSRLDLRWYVRPYSYDPRTVWKNGPVPLHPGAARYYREMGYMK